MTKDWYTRNIRKPFRLSISNIKLKARQIIDELLVKCQLIQ